MEKQIKNLEKRCDQLECVVKALLQHYARYTAPANNAREYQNTIDSILDAASISNKELFAK